jgi:hypothetical protein
VELRPSAAPAVVLSLTDPERVGQEHGMRYRQLPQLGSSRNRTLVALAAAGRLLQALRIGAFPRSASARSRLTARDKNHPCVVIWSIANEPDTVAAKSRAYFEPLFAEARRLDPTRPVGFANF